MRADMGLKGLVRSEGPGADRAAEWTVRGCGIGIRHRLRPETMDDGEAEFVGERKVEFESGASS